jgi:hypothetical protein
MPLSLKQQMALAVARKIVRNGSGKHSEALVRYALMVIENMDYWTKPEPSTRWPQSSLAWQSLVEFCPIENWPKLLVDQDTDARNDSGPQPETEQASEDEVNIDSHGTSVTPQ